MATNYTPSWDYDYTTGEMVNRQTGQRIAMTGVASPSVQSIWTSTYPAARVESVHLDKMIDEANRIYGEYSAMRTFLQHCYPEVLKQFDVAHAAAKRIGVQNDPNQTPST